MSCFIEQRYLFDVDYFDAVALDNFVRKGDIYELFYMNKKWTSAGIKKATADSLVYNNIPTETLLFLRNHSRGCEERPFIYENGEQIWW